MHFQETVSLDFVTSDGIPAMKSFRCRAFEEEWCAGVAQERGFLWTPPGFRDVQSAVKVVALVFVRLARWRGLSRPPYPRHLPLLQSLGTPSPPATLAYAIQRADKMKWVTAMFSQQREAPFAINRLRRWLHFGNREGKKKGVPLTVEAVTAELPPDAVEICLNGEVITGRKLDELERRLAGLVDGSLPPMPGGPSLSMKGYFPSIGMSFRGRAEELATLDEFYDDLGARAFIIAGGTRAGKTTLAREWLGIRAMSNTVRQSLVFGWEFPCQGYGANSGQFLAEFFHRLAVELNVKLAKGMLPRAVAWAIVEGMKSKPTMLFLDGLEVMIGRDCPLPGGITDAALAELLRRLADTAETHGSCVVATSRRPLREQNESGMTGIEAESLRINSLRNGDVAPKIQSASKKAVALLLDAIASEDSEGLQAGVRGVLEEFANRPARSLLLSLSFFQDAPDFGTLLGKR